MWLHTTNMYVMCILLLLVHLKYIKDNIEWYIRFWWIEDGHGFLPEGTTWWSIWNQLQGSGYNPCGNVGILDFGHCWYINLCKIKKEEKECRKWNGRHWHRDEKTFSNHAFDKEEYSKFHNSKSDFVWVQCDIHLDSWTSTCSIGIKTLTTSNLETA